MVLLKTDKFPEKTMKEKYSSTRGSIKKLCYEIANHPLFTNAIIAVILFNAVVIGLETYPSILKPNKELFLIIERLLLWIFSIEIAIRITAEDRWYRFFRDGWNNFDFIIVASSIILIGYHYISILRILRLLRVLRAISVIPSLQKLIYALLRTIPSLGNIMLLMGLIFYIFAVLGTIIFSEISPEYFGTLHHTLLTLFQIVTLESWASEIMRPINEIAPWAWMYFVSFVLVGTFVVINLFVGVIVNNVQESNLEIVDKSKTNQSTPPSREDIDSLKEEIASLKTMISELKIK